MIQELKKAHFKQAHDAEIVECEKTFAKKRKKLLMNEASIRRHWETACSRLEHCCEFYRFFSRLTRASVPWLGLTQQQLRYCIPITASLPDRIIASLVKTTLSFDHHSNLEVKRFVDSDLTRLSPERAHQAGYNCRRSPMPHDPSRYTHPEPSKRRPFPLKFRERTLGN